MARRTLYELGAIQEELIREERKQFVERMVGGGKKLVSVGGAFEVWTQFPRTFVNRVE